MTVRLCEGTRILCPTVVARSDRHKARGNTHQGLHPTTTPSKTWVVGGRVSQWRRRDTHTGPSENLPLWLPFFFFSSVHCIWRDCADTLSIPRETDRTPHAVFLPLCRPRSRSSPLTPSSRQLRAFSTRLHTTQLAGEPSQIDASTRVTTTT